LIVPTAPSVSFSCCHCAFIAADRSRSSASSRSRFWSRSFDALSVSFLSAACSIWSCTIRRSTSSISCGIESISMRRPRGRLVEQVDRLVGEEPVADVAVRQRGGRHHGAVGDADAVVRLVALLEPAEDRDRAVDARLAHVHRLEAALERGVLLDVLAVLVERGRAHDAQLAARERRLEHVARVGRALGLARADDGVQLVDEDDELALRVGELLEHRLEPLLELAAVLRAGEHRADVERHERLVAQRLGHVAVDDALREPLDDRRLADARLADEHRVVLRPAREHLDDAADLLVAADHRVELAAARALGEVGREALQRLVLLLGFWSVTLCVPRTARSASRSWSRPAPTARRSP
jgi:hypothetical protein